MCNEIDFILQIMITFACAFMISMGFCGGYFKAKYKERICTETVSGTVLEKKKYHFFFHPYYSLRIEFSYNDKMYVVKRGWFLKNVPEKLDVHIDPQNPEICYLKTLSERCGCMKCNDLNN